MESRAEILWENLSCRTEKSLSTEYSKRKRLCHLLLNFQKQYWTSYVTEEVKKLYALHWMLFSNTSVYHAWKVSITVYRNENNFATLIRGYDNGWACLCSWYLFSDEKSYKHKCYIYRPKHICQLWSERLGKIPLVTFSNLQYSLTKKKKNLL